MEVVFADVVDRYGSSKIEKAHALFLEAKRGILLSHGRPVEHRPQAGAGPSKPLSKPRLLILVPWSSRRFLRQAILLRPFLLMAEPVQRSMQRPHDPS
jgi:hypothetical protein